MIKGCQKRIVFLKNTGSEYFDEAYFVLKPDALERDEADIVSEATKIANMALDRGSRGLKHERIKRLGFFALGLAIGVTMTLLVILL